MSVKNVTPDPLSAVNAAFDSLRRSRDLKTDAALARSLGISPKTLSQLRHGRWTPVHQALITAFTPASSFQQKNN